MTPGSEVITLGIIVADVISDPINRLPQAGELIQVDEIRLSVGGCAANAGVDLARLGVRAAVVGKVGADSFGDVILQMLAQEGVDTRLIRRSPHHSTSKSIIVPVRGEDRRFIHNFGANADLGPEDLDLEAVAQTRVLYVGGYFALPRFTPADLRRVLAHAKAHGVITVLDFVVPSHAPGRELFDSIRPALPLVDYVLPNDDEAAVLTGEEEPLSMARAFLDAGCGAAVITLGARGSVVCTREKTIRAGAFSVPFVDGTGSGDAFDAGVIAGILAGWPLERVVAFASAVAASAVTALGATTAVFTRDQAEAFLGKHCLEMEVEVHG